ncbi:hypothetical protein STCU_03421 [Strigomonas culicis]|nr:hypothetical protein STCU_03421 [Strigomonas culicis]|eukprot:EPY31507.1 hypothetical protein STCU_03421 [Strigomonas culicis]
MAEEITDASAQEPFLLKGLELVQQSVNEDGNNFASHKWLGILLSAQHVSTKEKIANAYKIKEQFLKAVELNPADATSLHCMGNWCASVLKVSWLERKAAALLFGEPPSSTPEECLKYLLASAEAGDTIHNAKMIGDMYKQQGNKEEARKWYTKAVGMPADTELKKRNHDAAEKALSQL